MLLRHCCWCGLGLTARPAAADACGVQVCIIQQRKMPEGTIDPTLARVTSDKSFDVICGILIFTDFK